VIEFPEAGTELGVEALSGEKTVVREVLEAIYSLSGRVVAGAEGTARALDRDFSDLGGMEIRRAAPAGGTEGLNETTFGIRGENGDLGPEARGAGIEDAEGLSAVVERDSRRYNIGFTRY